MIHNVLPECVYRLTTKWKTKTKKHKGDIPQTNRFSSLLFYERKLKRNVNDIHKASVVVPI